MLSWDNIEASPEYQGLNHSERIKVKAGWFRDNVESSQEWGQLDDQQRAKVSGSFLSDEQPDRTVGGTIGDIGISLVKGVVGAGEAVVGLADIPTFGLVGKGLEAVGYDPDATHKILADKYSPAQKYANKELSAADGFVDSAKAMIENPSTIGHTVLESAPSMLGGGAIGRGVMKVAPTVSGLVAGAIGEGAMSAGQLAEQARRSSESGLLTPGKIAAAAAGGVGTGIFAIVGGRLSQKLGFADIDTMLAAGKLGTSEKAIARRIVEGGIAEGVFEELPQSMQEQVWSNAATNRPLGEGVSQAAAQGMFAGAAMGGGANILTSRADENMGLTPPNIETVKEDAVETGLFPAQTAGEQANMERDIIAQRNRKADPIQALRERMQSKINAQQSDKEVALEQVSKKSGIAKPIGQGHKLKGVPYTPGILPEKPVEMPTADSNAVAGELPDSGPVTEAASSSAQQPVAEAATPKESSVVDRRHQPIYPGGASNINQVPPIKNGIVQPERRINQDGQRETAPNASSTTYGRTAQTFTTAKGSTYKLHQDGTTTRDKAERVEHPGEKGVQPQSKKTWFVSYEDAVKLAEVQAQGGPKATVNELPDGRVGVRYLEGKDKGRYEKRTVISPHKEPAVGLLPVEYFGDNYTIHFGNKIKSIKTANPKNSGAADPKRVEQEAEITPGQYVRYNKGKYTVKMIEEGRAIIRNAKGEEVVDVSKLSPWQAKDRAELPREKEHIGTAWVGNQWRPIIGKRKITRGKNKGRYSVTLPNNTSRVVDESAIKDPGQSGPADQKQVDKIASAIKNETGSSELANDITRKAADLILDGVKTFREFRSKMQHAFKDVWGKIKKHMRDLYDHAKQINVKLGDRGELKVDFTKSKKAARTAPKKENAHKKQAKTVEQVRAEINRDIPGIIEKAAVFLKNPKHTKKGKDDLSYFGDLLASLPSFFAKKIEATKKIFEASQERQDDFHERIHWMENHDNISVVESWAALKKNGGLKKATDYLINNDRKSIGFSVKKKGAKWFVRGANPKNTAPLAEFQSSITDDFIDTGEVAAIEKMISLESEYLISKGFTKEQVKAVIAFRLSTNKGFDTLMVSIRRLIYSAKLAGVTPPEVVTFDGGKKVKVSLERAMAKMGDIRGFYFPRIRKPGKHVLRAFKKNEYNILETFTSRRLMNVKKMTLEKDGYKVETSLNEKLGEDVFQMAGGLVATQQIVNSALDRVETKLKNPGKKQIKSMQKEIEFVFASALAEQIANVIRERGSRVHMTRRSANVYIGYEEDAEQVIAKYIRGISAGEAKRQMVMKMLKALTGTDVSWKEFKGDNPKADYGEYANLVSEKMIDQAKQPNAFKWAINYIGENTRNQEAADRVIGIIKGVAVAKYLAFRVFSSPLVNLTALPTSTVASMKAAGIPYLKTYRLLSAGARGYLSYRTGKGKLSKKQSDVFDHIRHKGWDNPQFNSEAMTTLRSAVGRKYDKAIEYGMWTFSESERVNRAATIAASYNGLKAENPGLSFDVLMEKAKEVSDNSHGIYNKGNYPFIALGRHPAAHITRMFYVFRTFSHTYLANMHRVGFKEKDYGALAHMMVSPAVIAGAGASVITPVISSILSAFGIDEPEEQAYLKIGEMFGQGSENFARFGATSLLPGGGFSIKGSLAIGIGDMPTRMTVKDFLGAPGSVIDEIFHMAPASILRGDVAKGVEKALPTGIGNIIRAYREGSEGITTRTNAPVFYGPKQLKLSLVESIYRGFSFNPARIAGAREKQWAERKLDLKYRDFRTDIYSRIKKYVFNGNRDQNKWAEIIGEIMRYNEYATRRNLPLIKRQTIKANLTRSSRPNKRERMRKAFTN